MVLSNIAIMTHIGISAAADRNAVIGDFLSDGLSGLALMSDEDVKDACNSYAKRTDGDFPVILNQLHRQRMRALLLWVKDMTRAQQLISWPNGTGANQVNDELREAWERERMRKDQRKVGESYHDHWFNNKLKSQNQWEKFMEELESTLNMIIGSQGVPIIYVIREEEASQFDPTIPFEDAIIQAVAVDNAQFKIDARTVHQIILNNVDDNSDAYTYIKPLLRHHDGRRDILALRDRYSNDATKQAIINSAKATLENLRYKNERSFTFERFSAKMQKAYDDLKGNGREVDNGDIVDALWSKIQDSSLQSFLAALKIDYMRQPRSYKLLLQDIAGEIAGQKKVTFASGTRGVSALFTKDGYCPKEGVHTPSGSIFIGNYDSNKWHSESVKPYHKEIIDARSKDKSNQPSRSEKKRVNAVRRSKKKLKKLKKLISAAKVTIASTKRNDSSDDGSSDEEDNDSKAGNAFGGKNSVVKKKKKGGS